MNTDASQGAADLNALAKAVGLVVLQWGQAEQSLDLLVAILWHSFNGKRYAKKIPLMLEPKIEFVRACTSSDPGLSQFRDAAEELLEQFKDLSSVRHELIHGAVASISPVDNAFVFAKLHIHDGYHHHREVRFEVAEYPRLVQKLIDLGRMAHELAAAVFGVVKGNATHVK